MRASLPERRVIPGRAIARTRNLEIPRGAIAPLRSGPDGPSRNDWSVQGLTDVGRRAIAVDLRSNLCESRRIISMPLRLDRSSADFDELFSTFLAAKREVSADVERATRAIVDDVAARGDAALIEATKKFDRLDLEASALRVTAAEIDTAVKACDAITLDALKFA